MRGEGLGLCLRRGFGRGGLGVCKVVVGEVGELDRRFEVELVELVGLRQCLRSVWPETWYMILYTLAAGS